RSRSFASHAARALGVSFVRDGRTTVLLQFRKCLGRKRKPAAPKRKRKGQKRKQTEACCPFENSAESALAERAGAHPLPRLDPHLRERRRRRPYRLRVGIGCGLRLRRAFRRA